MEELYAAAFGQAARKFPGFFDDRCLVGAMRFFSRNRASPSA